MADFDAGLAEYKSAHYQQAAILFKRSAERTGDAQDLYWAAQSLCMSGQKGKGIQQFWSIVRTFPNSIEARTALVVLRKIDADFAKNSGSTALPKQEAAGTSASKGQTKESIIESMIKVEPSMDNSRPQVDPSFVETVKSTLKEFPLEILYLVSSKGCKIKIAPTVIDDDMRLSSTLLRFSTTSYKQVPSRFDGHDVIIAEHAYDAQGNLNKVTDCAGNIRHEMGRAFDVHDGNISDKQPFKHSYLKNWGVPSDKKANFDSFLARQEQQKLWRSFLCEVWR